MGQRRRSQHVRNESAYPPIAAGEQTSRLVGSVPDSDIRQGGLFVGRRQARASLPTDQHNSSGNTIRSKRVLGNVDAAKGTLCHLRIPSLLMRARAHKTEQLSSHPHDVAFDPSGRFVLVPDKGLDRVFVFRFDAASGRLSPAETDSVRTRPGAGPRHLAFHPKLAVVWVLNELDSTLASYRWDPERGALTPFQVVTTLPTDFTGY